MQNVIIEKPYRFVPPLRSAFWPELAQRILPFYLRKAYAITRVDSRHLDRLAASIDAGHGILLTPNHSKICDPLVLGPMMRPLKKYLYVMASWHLYNQDWFTRFVIRRIGGFSIYREGTDRQAMHTAIELLAEAERPLVIFPEGVVSRHNDVILPMLDGVALVARQAARKRAKASGGKVVVHPIALRYFFRGDLEKTIEPIVRDIEERLSWQPLQDVPLLARINRIAEGALALKEVEYLGKSQTGRKRDRVTALIERILAPLEEEWQVESSGSVHARVKRLRIKILPDMIEGTVDEAERARRWKQLAAMYYAQQFSSYTDGYVTPDPTDNLPEHILETVQMLEEDITGRIRSHGPLHAVVEIGEAIEVSPERRGRSGGDPLMRQIKEQLQTMLAKLSGQTAGLPAGEEDGSPSAAETQMAGSSTRA